MMKNTKLKKDKKLDLIKHFPKLFKLKEDAQGEVIGLLKDNQFKMFMNNTNVVGVVPKKVFIRDYLRNNFDCTEREFNPKVLNFTNTEGENISSYGSELLAMVLPLALNSEVIKIKMGKDTPIWLETEDLILIIAPRVLPEVV